MQVLVAACETVDLKGGMQIPGTEPLELWPKLGWHLTEDEEIVRVQIPVAPYTIVRD